MRDKWLTPDAPASGYLCRTIRIPNGEEFWAAVNGALLELTYPWNWEQHGDLSPEQTAALFVGMYEDYRESRGCVLGTIFAHALANVPDGALACNGAVYDRDDYPTLYDSIDTTYHVDSTSFRVPDLRSRTPIGTGQGSGLTSRAIDDSGGAESHVLVVGEMPVHQHTITGPALNPLTTGPVPNFSQSGLATATATAGAGGAHQNMPPFRALHYAIWAR